LLVSDRFEGRELETAFLNRPVRIGRDQKIDRISGDILRDNVEMKQICEKLGFRLMHTMGDPAIKAAIDLYATGAQS
jgi:acetyltransferase